MNVQNTKVVSNEDIKLEDSHWLERTSQLIGEGALTKLKKSSVAIFGLGGVGSFAAEAIARCGIEAITLVDFDIVNPSNLNRQLVALNSTIGMYKIDVMKDRIIDINPDCKVKTFSVFANKDNIPDIIDGSISYVIDAIDSVGSKLDLIEYCFRSKINFISSMGTGNKVDPSKFKLSDISKTEMCPLARAIRIGLKKRDISKGVEVLYSTEIPKKQNKTNPASISFVPSVAGFILAGQVIRKLASI